MRGGAVVAGLALALAFHAGAQQQPQQHVRGDVTKVYGDTMDVRTGAGQVLQVRLADDVGVVQAEEASPGAIADGAYIGTTAVAQPDGSLRALEVHVFPDAMRGAGEGHRPWDLKPGSSMTNATVSGMKQGAAKQGTGSGSSMTNATVSETKKSGAARTLTLKYQGGEQTVLVPPKIPIVRLGPGDRSMLAPGAHVFAVVAQQDDGALVAQRVIVGKDGVVPPM